METLTAEQIEIFGDWLRGDGFPKNYSDSFLKHLDRMLTDSKLHVIDNDHHIAHTTPSSKRLKDTG